MRSVAAEFRALDGAVGRLVARHSSARSRESFAGTGAFEFIARALGESLFDKQLEIIESAESHRLTCVVGCHGSGKDHAAGAYALHQAVACGRLVLLTGPSDRQVKEILMRRHVRRAFRRARTLPGELYEMALRFADDDTGAAGILAFTASDPDRFTGHHAPAGVTIIITEAQGVAPEIYEAAYSCMTGEADRMVVLGNPLRRTGTFYEIAQSRDWNVVRIAAADTPNVQQQRTVIRGAITQQWIDQIAATYGRDSAQYRAKVLAEFPSESAESLIRASWIDEAERRWHEQQRRGWGGAATFAVDVAHHGPDSTVLAVHQNYGVRELVQWRGKDTSQSSDKIVAHAQALDPRTQPSVVVDATGLGWGVVDTLKSWGWHVVPFVAAAAARNQKRFANSRAEAGWALREALEVGWALPPDPALREELLALTWRLDTQGRIELTPKDELRSTLKRSPDRADAVALLAWRLRPARSGAGVRIRAGAFSGLTRHRPSFDIDPRPIPAGLDWAPPWRVY